MKQVSANHLSTTKMNSLTRLEFKKRIYRCRARASFIQPGEQND